MGKKSIFCVNIIGLLIEPSGIMDNVCIFLSAIKGKREQKLCPTENWLYDILKTVRRNFFLWFPYWISMREKKNSVSRPFSSFNRKSHHLGIFFCWVILMMVVGIKLVISSLKFIQIDGNVMRMFVCYQ